MRGVFVLVCWLQVCAGSRILVVFPVPGDSHAVLGDSLVNILLDGGHEVTYVRPHSAIKPHEALTSVDIGSVAQDAERTNLLDLIPNPRALHSILETGTSYAEKALRHPAVTALLQDPEVTFDLVVAEWFYSGLPAPLASLYECPLIWYSGSDASWLSLRLVGEQTNPAYTAHPQARHAVSTYTLRDRMDRIRDQAYMTLWNYYMTYFVEATAYIDIFRNPLQLRGRFPLNYEDLLYNASMLLINSQPSLGQVLSLPSSAKYIGGHHVEIPTKALSKKLQQLLDHSNNGVIFVNLGSKVRSKDLPKYMTNQLAEVFGQLYQTVIWMFEEPILNLPNNVYVFKKVPYMSILNHKNTVLFITDGSITSYTEAMYFGVPIIGIPMFEDQFLTMDLAWTRGHGIRVGFTRYLPHRIKDAVKEIMQNYIYQINVKKASTFLRGSLVSPQKELLHCIELVITYGADHLRSPALRLTIFERLFLDVVALVLMFAWFLTKVWKVVKAHFRWNPEAVADPEEEDKKEK